MLNEEKVIMMTRMASYESGKGKEDLRIGSYFRGDYVASALLKAVFAITFTFAFVIIGYVVYNFETFMENAYTMDVAAIVKSFGKYYLIALIIYVVISYAVCLVKYMLARKNIKKYKNNLKKIRMIDKSLEKANE